MENKEHYHVVAAVVRDGDKYLCMQRCRSKYEYTSEHWEFPGGKLEPGETSQETLVREIREELKADIDIQELLCTVEYDYPAFHLSMDCFLCTLVSSSMTLVEAEDAKWLSLQELDSVNWLPADQSILQTLRQRATASTC